MAIIVSPAFLGSGGLNAGTPLAMASVPVRATEPEANASQEQEQADRLSGPGSAALRLGGRGTTAPVTTRKPPMTTSARASPTNR